MDTAFAEAAAAKRAAEEAQKKEVGQSNSQQGAPPSPASPKSIDLDSTLLSLKLDEGGASDEVRDLFVTVDNPEKHVTTMESFVTFQVNTKVDVNIFIIAIVLR